MKNKTQYFLCKTFLALLLAFGFSTQAQQKNIEIQNLPVEAKLFLTKHFSKQTINTAIEDKDYKVSFANGTEVEFDKKGNWEEVDGKGKPIPTAILPTAILTYLKANYAAHQAVKIDKGTLDYEVKLDNGIELKFGLDGKFLRIDD